MIKIIAISAVLLIVCSAGAFACFTVGKYFEDRQIKSFDECVASFGIVNEENQRVCTDSRGNIFVQEP